MIRVNLDIIHIVSILSRHAEEPRTSEIAMPQFMHSTTQNSKDAGFSPAPANKYKECEVSVTLSLSWYIF